MCTPVSIVQIEPFEDEGHCWISDVGNDTLLFFGGQDFPPSRKFPNDEFELVLGATEMRLVPRGRQMRPSMIVRGADSKNLVKPSAVFTFPGYTSSALSDYTAYLKTVEVESLYLDLS